MNLKPRHSYVHVVRDTPPTHTEGGLLIPEQARALLNTGTIVAVGPSVTDLKVGDHVLWTEVAGTEMRVLNQSILLMKEVDIIGVIDHADKA